jgi:hypothetical protein
MDELDLWLWSALALVYAVSAVGLQRMLRRFIDPFQHRTRSPAEQS